MQAIHIKRYDHPESTGYAGSIEPEDRSWILFIPNNGSMPQLFIEVEVPAEEGAPLNEDTPTTDRRLQEHAPPARYLCPSRCGA